MSEDIQEIERLIKQSAEFSESLVRLMRKIQEQDRSNRHVTQQQQDLRALLAKLTDLRSHIDVGRHEIGPERNYDEALGKARQAMAEQTATPQEAVIELLRAAVADKTMAPEQAVEELVKLLRTDLPVSRRIEIRETAKAAFEAGDDVASNIRPFLKNGHDHTQQQRKGNKRVFTTAPGQRM